MNKINEAYDRIVNPEKYAARDRRAAASNPGAGYGAGGAAGGAGYAGGTGTGGAGGAGGTGQNPYGSEGPYGWTGGFGFDFDDLFGFGGPGGGARGPIHPEASAADGPAIRSVIDAINAGRFQQAIDQLNAVTSDGRNARWYYLSALANDGAGNSLMALEQIRRAVRLDPNNPDYQRAQRQFQPRGTPSCWRRRTARWARAIRRRARPSRRGWPTSGAWRRPPPRPYLPATRPRRRRPTRRPTGSARCWARCSPGATISGPRACACLLYTSRCV